MGTSTATIYIHHSPVGIGKVHSALSFIAAAVHRRRTARPAATRYFGTFPMKTTRPSSHSADDCRSRFLPSTPVFFLFLYIRVSSRRFPSTCIYILRRCIITYSVVCAVRPQPAARTSNTRPSRSTPPPHPVSLRPPSETHRFCLPLPRAPPATTDDEGGDFGRRPILRRSGLWTVENAIAGEGRDDRTTRAAL